MSQSGLFAWKRNSGVSRKDDRFETSLGSTDSCGFDFDEPIDGVQGKASIN